MRQVKKVKRPDYLTRKTPDTLLDNLPPPESGLPQTNAIDLASLTLEEKEQRLGDLWKVFGMNTAAGKSLFQMFGNKYKQKISYPKPKTKKWSAAEAKNRTLKNNKYNRNGSKRKQKKPQIEYPPVVTKADLARKRRMRNFNKLDLLPKRRGKNAILADMEERRKDRYVPKNKGRNRAKMIDDLQDKFKYANDPIKKYGISEKEDEKIKLNLQAQLRKEAAKNNFYHIERKLGKEQPKFDKGGDELQNPRLRELNGLFDAVCAEIEERQEYLQEVEMLDMEDTKSRIKQEIADRVAELQKINRLIKKEREQNGVGKQKF